jgi:hypothetical protein
LAHTQVWPALRYLLTIAPSTALSMSASSKTMKGALPPSSRLSFLIVGAHCAARMRPTSVEPVNDRWRTTSLAHSTLPTRSSVGVGGDDVQHARGHAGALRQFGHGQGRQRRLLGRLDDHRAAGGQRRRHLARDHRDRESSRA